MGPRLLAMLGLMGAFGLLFALAEGVTRQGLVNGYVLLLVAGSLLLPQATASREIAAELSPHWRWLLGSAALAAVVFVTLLSAGRSTAAKTSATFPLPLSGITPLAQAASLVALPATLTNLGFELETLSEWTARSRAPYFALLVTCTVLLAWLFAMPSRVRRVATDLGLEVDDGALRSTFLGALAASLLVVVALALASSGAAEAGFGVDATTVALATALAIDLVKNLRIYRGSSPWVGLWEDRRPYAAYALARALCAEGIECRVHGGALGSLLSFFGPYAPIGVLVRAADIPAAQKVLARMRPGGERSAQRKPAAAVAPRFGVAQLVGIATCALVAAISWLLPSHGQAAGPRAELGMYEVADDVDLNWSELELPEGAERRKQQVDEVVVDYLHLPPSPGRDDAQSLSQLRQWAEGVNLPAGTRLAFGPDETLEGRGFRSYLLRSPPFLTQNHVADASAVEDELSGASSVNIELTEEGGRLMHEATTRLTRRRIAIVVDGVVESAPLVLAPIPGGTARITLEGSDPRQQLLEARELAARLRPR
jgi:hypothetical protein